MKPTNILLVDDVDYTRELLRSAIIACIDDNELPLRPTFFQTSNGEQVLDLIKSKGMHLVYLDIDLDTVNGLDVLTDIKKEYPDITVIMCSGEASSDNVMQAIKTGANGFIVKPFNSGRISESLKKFIALGESE